MMWNVAVLTYCRAVSWILPGDSEEYDCGETEVWRVVSLGI
jgi:hypothetical protein